MRRIGLIFDHHSLRHMGHDVPHDNVIAAELIVAVLGDFDLARLNEL